MTAPGVAATKKFCVELIRPSHYDDDGYVIQWVKAWIPANSLACLYGLTRAAMTHRVLGEDVEIVLNAYDESNTVLPVKKIIERIRRAGGSGVVCMVGVQSNQYPRALDLARRFRAAGVQVAIGGFHVSGCMAMIPQLTPELQEALDLGITLFAGEAEGRFDEFLLAAYRRELEPIYNFMSDLPDLRGQVMPYLPREVTRRYWPNPGTFDAGRGCPFLCSFCTIINVQGRTSRYRSADDIEALLRENLEHDIRHYFITDDNFARNWNWEAIFDRLAGLRRELNVWFSITIQVDTLCHKMPGFVRRARQAGVSRVFIGLENINPDSLQGAQKKQNKVSDYREMLLAWQKEKVTTYCGYILGFPGDSQESILADIERIKRELPLDILEFFYLTPLPGSADHQRLYKEGAPLDPDLNIYDLEHVCTPHSTMTAEEWEGAYRKAWDSYYSLEHLERLMRRGSLVGRNPQRIMEIALEFYACSKFEKVHPLQGGFFRRKLRKERRPTLPREHPFVFYPRRLVEVATTYYGFAAYGWRLWRLCRRVKREAAIPRPEWIDEAMQPLFAESAGKALPAVEAAPPRAVANQA